MTLWTIGMVWWTRTYYGWVFNLYFRCGSYSSGSLHCSSLSVSWGLPYRQWMSCSSPWSDLPSSDWPFSDGRRPVRTVWLWVGRFGWSQPIGKMGGTILHNLPHHAIYVTNSVRYSNDDNNLIQILHFYQLNVTIQRPTLNDVSPLDPPGAWYFSLYHKCTALRWSVPCEKLVCIDWIKHLSTRLKLTTINDIQIPVLGVLWQTALDADGGRLLLPVRPIHCWPQLASFIQLINHPCLVV